MFDDIFIKVYHNGYCVVAEFERPFGFMYGNDRRSRNFVLAAPALQIRIANRIKQGMSVVQEKSALSAIEAMEKNLELEQ